MYNIDKSHAKSFGEKVEISNRKKILHEHFVNEILKHVM